MDWLSGVNEWGVEKNGGVLHINAPWPSFKYPIAIDVENNEDGSCAGLGLSDDGINVYFYTPDEVEKFPKDRFSKFKFVGHNFKYDVQMLWQWGFSIHAEQLVWDTQLAEYVKDSTKNKYGLKALVQSTFGAVYPTFKELAGTGKKAVSIGSLPLSVVANYNGLDVLFTYRLYAKQIGEYTNKQHFYMTAIELPCSQQLAYMESRGIQINANYIRSLHSRLCADRDGVLGRLCETAHPGFNPNSPKQVKEFLLAKAGLRLDSTAAETLRNHEVVPLVKSLLRYRELSKLISTYTNVLLERSNGQETYRLHGRFNQSITHTGRLSASDPNLQNIPTRTEEGALIREGFIAAPGQVLIDGDFGQIEPRIMAHLSGDKALSQVFLNDEDLYDAVTKAVGMRVTKENRRISKVLWLAMAYNAGAYKIAKTAKIDQQAAETFLAKMRAAFPSFFYWREQVMKKAEIEGYVTTLFGREIPLSQDMAHLAPNYKIQGSAAEIMKLAIAQTSHYRAVCTVHDELIFEHNKDDAEAAMKDIKEIMENVVHLSVPLKVDCGIGMNWNEAKA